jgi:DNA-binding beta-propeller fold protein YncE
VFVNTLPTGTINITTEQYATAPANLPVFITPDKNLRVDFTIDSYDAEIGGPIESYDPNNLIWYANTGDGAGYVHCGNGSTLSQDLPVGSTTIKVEIYDSFYGKHPNATETMTIAHKHLHIWQSIDFAYTSALIPAASPVFITGKDKKLYITDNISAEIHECTFEKAVATGPLSLDETHTPDASFALDNGLCGVLFGSKVTLLGAEGLDLKLISFGSVPTGSPITQNDLNLTTSIAFNSKNTAAKTAYAANQGEVISFHSETGAFIGQTDPVLSLGNMLRVRFSTAFSPNGNVFIADKENNRVVFLSPDLSNPTSKNAASPIDMAFTKTMLMTLDDSTDEISLINPVTNNILMKFGGTGATPGKFSNPISIYSTGQDLFVLEDGKMQVIRTKFADWLRP